MPRVWGGGSEAEVKPVELRGKKDAPGRGAANARTDANRGERRGGCGGRGQKEPV